LEDGFDLNADQAVLTYRRIARQQYDNDLPESFIGAFIAPLLHERFKVPVRTEFSYLRIAMERLNPPKKRASSAYLVACGRMWCFFQMVGLWC